MTKLEDNLRITYGKAVYKRGAAAQDECTVVQAEIGGIAENNLANLGPEAGLWRRDKSDFERFCRALYQLAEVAQALRRDEAVRLQDELGLEVLDAVLRMAIAVGGRFGCNTFASRLTMLGLLGLFVFLDLVFLVFLELTFLVFLELVFTFLDVFCHGNAPLTNRLLKKSGKWIPHLLKLVRDDKTKGLATS